VAAGIFRVQAALAVAQTGDEGAARVLTENVAVRATCLLEGVLDDAGQPLADRTEEAVPGLDDLVLRVGRPLVAAIVIPVTPARPRSS